MGGDALLRCPAAERDIDVWKLLPPSAEIEEDELLALVIPGYTLQVGAEAAGGWGDSDGLSSRCCEQPVAWLAPSLPMSRGHLLSLSAWPIIFCGMLVCSASTQACQPWCTQVCATAELR